MKYSILFYRDNINQLSFKHKTEMVHVIQVKSGEFGMYWCQRSIVNMWEYWGTEQEAVDWTEDWLMKAELR